jgi:hypothetical protein
MATFEATVRSSSIAAGGTYNVTFTTGSNPAVFLNRIVSFVGSAGGAVVYEAPTGVSGGTATSMFKLDQMDPQTIKGVMTQGVTIGGVGTQISAPSYYKGTAGGPAVGTYAPSTGFRRLKPFTTYLLQFTNSDVGAQVIDIYFRWYEGPDPHPQGN